MAVYKKISDVKTLYLKGNRTELLKTYSKEQLRAAEAVLNNFCAVVEANNLYLEKVEIEPNPEENTETEMDTVAKEESIVPNNVGRKNLSGKVKKEKVVEEIMDDDDEDDDADIEEEPIEEDEEDEEEESIFK